MKKSVKIFAFILCMLALSTGTVTSQQPSNRPPVWQHWTPELCWLDAGGGMVISGYMCTIPDPYGPCFIDIYECTPIEQSIH